MENLKYVDLDKEYENYRENFAKGAKEITDSYNAMRLVLGGGAR